MTDVGQAATAELATAAAAPAPGWLPRTLGFAAVALALWIGVTMSWSIVGDRSWDAFNKAVAYCAFLGLGVVLASIGRRFGARLAARFTQVSGVAASLPPWRG